MKNTSIWTKEELQEQIVAYKAALLACASGKSYTIGSRTLTRADISDIRKQLDYFANEIAALEGRRGLMLVSGRLHSPYRYRQQ